MVRTSDAMSFTSSLVVSLLGLLPFPSRRQLYLKTYGPGVD